MNMKKILVLALSLVLVAAISITGTLAWLQDDTQTIKNTFTYGSIDIELNETKGTNGEENEKLFKMIPGSKIEKDPKVTVKANSEKSYVFIELAESDNLDDFITYAIDDSIWTEYVKGSVYYRLQDATTADVTYSILSGDAVTVNGTVTKEMMDELQKDTTLYPTLSFTAYAVQQDNLTVDEAWTVAKGGTVTK